MQASNLPFSVRQQAPSTKRIPRTGSTAQSLGKKREYLQLPAAPDDGSSGNDHPEPMIPTITCLPNGPKPRASP
jgi:hypothetical protein